MSLATTSDLLRLRCLTQHQENVLILDKKKTLIGSHHYCDFKLLDKSVSSYHAFLCVKGEGVMVKDLYSEGGVFVNGQRIEESFVKSGDVLKIGTLSFAVESLQECAEIDNPDAGIHVIESVSTLELPLREGLILIDGEYCDITFNETHFIPLQTQPHFSFYGDHVELDAILRPLEIAHSAKGKRLEIISYMNGLMMDVCYIPLYDGAYYLDPFEKSKFNILFYSGSRTKIFSIKDGKLRFYPTENVIPSVNWEDINMSEPLFLTHGSEQLSLRFVESTTQWHRLPIFYRDREFFKQGGKVFATIFLPMLLLLFIGVDKQQDVLSEVAVIYKLPTAQTPTEAQEKSDVKAQELTSKTENSAQKENDRRNDKVEFSAGSSNKKLLAKNSTPAPAKAPPVASISIKTYEFKSTVSMESLVADSPNINTQSSGKSAIKDTTFNSGASDDGQLVAGADIGVSKFNGPDEKGSGPNSYGPRGLASKSDFDTSYLETKTVVLGSMDPELLREILREYIPQFRHCYQQELIGTSDKIKGVIDLNFTIGPSGKVSRHNIKAKDALFSQKGIGCMGEVLNVIDFPKPKGGGVVDVRQPLNFFAESEKI
jgi:hypothetical protein